METIDVGTDNLSEIGDVKYVFDNTKSNLRALVGHKISFVLPTWIGQEGYKTVMLKGTVTYLKFNLEDEPNLDPKFSIKHGVVINGIKYKIPDNWKSIHQEGCVALKNHMDNRENDIPGADIPAPPKTLSLLYVHVKIDANEANNRLIELKNKKDTKITQRELEEVINKCQSPIRKATIIEQEPQIAVAPVGAEMRRKEPSYFVISIPIGWVVQNLTAMDSWNSSHKTELIPFIKIPVAFPSFKSRIVFTNDNDEEKIGAVEDFNLMEDGKTIGAYVSLVDEEDVYEVIFYSNLLAKSMDVLLNPKIEKVINTEDISKLMDNYLEVGRELIRDSLKKWTFFSITGLRILANEYNGTNDSDEPVFKPKWIPPTESIGNKKLHIVSFVSGEATIKGKHYHIVHKEKIDDKYKDKLIDIASIPDTKSVNRLVFNAAIGTAEGMVDGKKVQAFFSTANGVEISTRRIPLFGPVVPTDRVSVDVTNFKRVLGYLSKGRDKNHPDQKVVMWTVVPEAFRRFYYFVVKQGNHEIFNNKSAQEIREMFESDEFPTLIDIYNFILYGVNKRNKTRDSKWTKHIILTLMGLDYDKLIEMEDSKNQ